jgi:hypothetical protein
MAVSEKQQNFTVQSTTQVDNAAAVIYMNTRYILYNPSFINQLDNAANNKWASISVLAHEIGHHLYGHTLDGRGSQIPKELEADEYSGVVLKRMGATLQDAQTAMQLISSPNASATHPGQRDRLTAIARGWSSTSGKTVTDNRDVAIEYPTQNDRSKYPPNDNRSHYPAPNNRNNYPGTNTYPETETRRSYPLPNDPNNNPGNNGRGTYPNTRNNPGNNRNTRPAGTENRTSSYQTLLYEVRFNSVNGQQYFITSGNNVVKANGNRLLVVAKITNSNSRNYPYIIYDDQTQLFVDRRGMIYTNNGRAVGQITPRS